MSEAIQRGADRASAGQTFARITGALVGVGAAACLVVLFALSLDLGYADWVVLALLALLVLPLGGLVAWGLTAIQPSLELVPADARTRWERFRHRLIRSALALGGIVAVALVSELVRRFL